MLATQSFSLAPALDRAIRGVLLTPVSPFAMIVTTLSSVVICHDWNDQQQLLQTFWSASNVKEASYILNIDAQLRPDGTAGDNKLIPYSSKGWFLDCVFSEKKIKK
jgi:hypothetical protein